MDVKPISSFDESEEDTLEMEVMESPTYAQGRIFKIFRGNLENTNRIEKDGRVYFGFDNGQNEIDIELTPSPDVEDQKGKYCVITYNYNNSDYYIRDINCFLGIFAEVKGSKILEDNFMLLIGDYYILGFSNEEDPDSLNIKVYKGNDPEGEYDYKSSDIITFGKTGGDTLVVLDDESLSRKQCLLKYENKRWVVYDGDGKYRKSINGTFFRMNPEGEQIKIFDGMRLKIDLDKFQCKIG